MKTIKNLIVGTLLVLSAMAAKAAELANDPNYVNIGLFDAVATDLRYATENNFVGQNLYGDFKTAYLHKDAAEKFNRAVELLKKEKPGWKFLVFDALRPRSIQRRLFAKVKGTPQQSYVADPDKGSVHNYGFALDLSLQDENGREVDMGTAFDSFQPVAQPRYEDKFLREGKLTTEQVAHRKILRDLMTRAGFKNISNEWWHFDGLPFAELKARYKIVE